MNIKTKIIIATSLTLVVCTSMLFILNKKDNTEQKETYFSEAETKKIIDSVEKEETHKTAKFETYEEMTEYTETLNKIQNIDEATSFITKFLKSCEYNSIDKTMVYFNEYHWDNVVENGLVPAYDPTGTFKFKVEDIKVKESGNTDEFLASYKLIINDSETDETFAVLEREDTILLWKIFEDVEIINYERHTINHTIN